LPSATGIIYAVFVSHIEEDGQRGGAVGTALSVVFVFLMRAYGMRLYDAAVFLSQQQAASSNPDDLPLLSIRIKNLANAVATDAREAQMANYCLPVATSLAALTCGFGDKIAQHFIELRPHS
jgi:hypothetical protein